MHFEFGLRSSLLLIFFTHLLVYALLFWKRGFAYQRLSDRLLGTFFFLSSLFIFPWMSGFAGWYDTQPYREILFYMPFVQALFFGPLLFLYLKSLTNTNYSITKKDWLHFLPGSILLLWSFIVFVVDKVILGHYYLMNGKTDPDFDSWYGFTWSISLLVYLFLAIKYYRQYIVFSEYELSFADSASFIWLRNFLYAFSLLAFLLFSEHILGLFIELHYVRSWYYFLAFACITYYMAISAYSAKPVSLFKLNFEPELLLAYREPLQIIASKAMQDQVIQEDQQWMERWKTQLIELMEKDKVYLDPELTLTGLSRKTGTNPSLLSKVINSCFGQNFNDYINTYRVQETIRLMADERYRYLNILIIAYDAGFNSKSTFNRAFKKTTGMIPKIYLENKKDSSAI
jgi:AraC-like DNA-binding protein